jgi:hypothetical protein
LLGPGEGMMALFTRHALTIPNVWVQGNPRFRGVHSVLNEP